MTVLSTRHIVARSTPAAQAVSNNWVLMASHVVSLIAAILAC